MIPLVDLRAQYQGIKDEIAEAVNRVLETGQFILGPEVAAFEEEFAAFCGARHAVGLNSGTSALHLAMLAAGIGPGDEVITVPMTFVATVAAILYCGARPVFVDVDPLTYTMDPTLLEAAVTQRTKAILPVHLYGQMADMDPILAVAKKRGLLVIEDAAQAHGAAYKGKPAGTLGSSGCFSFYPGKNLGAYGEGGAVVTNDDEVARKIRMLRNWGSDRRYFHTLKGYNYRLEGMQGAVLRVKLRKLLQWTEARRSRAELYNKLLVDSGVETPHAAAHNRHVYHIYAVRTDRRDELLAKLEKQGIGAAIHYPIPVHLQEAYADLGYRAGDFPVSERVARQELSLPIYPELTDPQVEQIAAAVKAAATG